MPDKKNQIGVITEQGFVMGDNLGFKPVKEKLDPSKKDKKEEDKKKKTTK